MRPYAIVCCVLFLAGPSLIRAQEGGYVSEGSDYSDVFGEEGDPSDSKTAAGPHSLDDARKEGRAYRLGQAGSTYRKPDRDIHVVQQGDTLWDLSGRYFGDPWHWPELWSYNPEITNPHWIYPLDQLRLTSNTLASDKAQAAQKAAEDKAAVEGTAGGTFVEPKQRLLTELAPRVTVSQKLIKPDTIFLHDQGYLDDDAIKAAGQIIGGNAEQMFMSDSDEVYLKFKKGQEIRAGEQFTVYRQIEKWERIPTEKGKLVRILGTVVVRSYDREHAVARGLITETIEPIERGLFVTRMERRFDLVPPKRNEVNVVAHVVASVQPRQLLAFGHVVFLDVGEGHGIQPGNRFFAVRRGDNWQDVLKRPARMMGNIADIPTYNKEELPKEVVAELRVIKVRKNVTVALISSSNTDLADGELVEMRQGF